jgi:hypothetical protein
MEADGVLAMVRWLGLDFTSFTVGATWRPGRASAAFGSTGRFDSKAFFAAADAKREQGGLTWKEVASEVSGFSPGMLTRLSRGGRMGVDQVVSLSCWLGRAPEEFIRSAKS